MYSSTNVLNGFVCNINMKMLNADEDTKLVCYNYLFYLWLLITGYNILLISLLPILYYTLYLSHNIRFSNNVVCVTSKGSDQPAHMRSLIRAFACHLNILCFLGY